VAELHQDAQRLLCTFAFGRHPFVLADGEFHSFQGLVRHWRRRGLADRLGYRLLGYGLELEVSDQLLKRFGSTLRTSDRRCGLGSFGRSLHFLYRQKFPCSVQFRFIVYLEIITFLLGDGV